MLLYALLYTVKLSLIVGNNSNEKIISIQENVCNCKDSLIFSDTR